MHAAFTYCSGVLRGARCYRLIRNVITYVLHREKSRRTRPPPPPPQPPVRAGARPARFRTRCAITVPREWRTLKIIIMTVRRRAIRVEIAPTAIVINNKREARVRQQQEQQQQPPVQCIITISFLFYSRDITLLYILRFMDASRTQRLHNNG